MSQPKINLGLLIAGLAGVFAAHGPSFEQGSAAHRQSGSYQQTASDLARIAAAQAKRSRRQYRNAKLLQDQRCRQSQKLERLAA